MLLHDLYREANADDGLLEIFGLKHGWHASFVMEESIWPSTVLPTSLPLGYVTLE